MDHLDEISTLANLQNYFYDCDHIVHQPNTTSQNYTFIIQKNRIPQNRKLFSINLHDVFRHYQYLYVDIKPDTCIVTATGIREYNQKLIIFNNDADKKEILGDDIFLVGGFDTPIKLIEFNDKTSTMSKRKFLGILCTSICIIIIWYIVFFQFFITF